MSLLAFKNIILGDDLGKYSYGQRNTADIYNTFEPLDRNATKIERYVHERLDDCKTELREVSVVKYNHLLEKYIYTYFKGSEIIRITKHDIEFICSKLLE